MRDCTRTRDEQDLVNPYKPFPDDPYFPYILDVLKYEPVVFLEKSRTMLMSWCVSAYFTWLGFTHPATCTVFVSEDESRSVHDVEYCKVLWENSSDALKVHWKLEKPIEKQAYNELCAANGSRWIGLPGKDPNKIRSEHPTAVVMDEAAHVTQGEACYNIAIATRCLSMICLSSAWPGWFREMTEFATPVDWPEYARGVAKVE